MESAVLWITLPTVLHGPSCKEKSPPYSGPLEQELHQLLPLEPGLQLEAERDLPVEQHLEVETSLSKKRERRDGEFHANQDTTQQQAGS